MNADSTRRDGKEERTQSKSAGRGGFKNTKNFSHGTEPSECYRCGFADHKGTDPKCPARNKTCIKCHKDGHFARKCKYKKSTPQQSAQTDKGGRVHYVVGEGESAFAFQVVTATNQGEDNTDDRICVNIGGCKTDFLIDSGCSTNIVTGETWEQLKKKGINCTSERDISNKRLYPYGSHRPLQVLGTFKCQVIIEGHSVLDEEEFTVVKEKGCNLLGKKTALALGILKLGVHQVSSGKTDSPDWEAEYPTVFKGLGKLKDFQLKIAIDDYVEPVAQKARRVPFGQREKLEKKIMEMEDLGVVEKVQGPTPWVSPVVIVPKPSGDIRLCVDMRQANSAVIRERHPIPTVEEILQDFNASTVFSKLDLKWGFHQIELKEESRVITTFATHMGLYRYTRLMFGISSAPEVYQHIIRQVLSGCEGAQNIADDIIVHGSSVEEHNKRLRKVLDTLKEKGLTVNDKSKFNLTKVSFYGYVFSQHGIGIEEEKTRAVKEARKPTNASEVRSFLGLVNYSGRFIPQLATLSEPLRRLTCKNAKFIWTQEQEESFRLLKEKITNADVLAYYDKDRKTKVIVDASPLGLGAVLVQQHPEGDRVVAYASRSLTDVEKRYSQTEKESLAIVWGCEHFNLYLLGKEFQLITDHRPLEFIYSARSRPSARIERWVLRLQPYAFTVKYKPGSKNIADVLSRLLPSEEGKVVIVESGQQEMAEEYVQFVTDNSVPIALSRKELEREAKKDALTCELKKCLATGDFSKQDASIQATKNELTCSGDLVLRGTRILIPETLRKQVLKLGHEGHQGIIKTKQRLRSKVWWPRMDQDAEQLCKQCYACQLVGQKNPPTPIESSELPKGPWEKIGVDLLGPFPGGESVFVAMDYYSRYSEIEIMNSTSATAVIKALNRIFATHGLPCTLVSDNGPQFISDNFKDFMKVNDIHHARTTPYWPQANGLVERHNRTLLKAIKTACSEGKDWRAYIYTFLLAYRSTPHTITGKSPAEIMFGRKLRTKLPEMERKTVEDTEIRSREEERKAKIKEYGDGRRKASESTIKVGDKVLVTYLRKANKLSTTFGKEIHEVVGRKGNQVIVKGPDGVKSCRNTTHVKLYHSENGEGSGQENAQVPDGDLEVQQRPRRSTRSTQRPEYVYGL